MSGNMLSSQGNKAWIIVLRLALNEAPERVDNDFLHHACALCLEKALLSGIILLVTPILQESLKISLGACQFGRLVHFAMP
jgi:hypothetical protein